MPNQNSRHPKVDLDIDQLADFISLNDLDASFRFVDVVNSAISLIETTPELGPVFRTDMEALEGIRCYPVPFPDSGRHRPYLIFYKLMPDNTIRILYVFHGARDIKAQLKKDVRY